jgi:hypothetical protein
VNRAGVVCAAVTAVCLAGCSRSDPDKKTAAPPESPPPPRITQLYVTQPAIGAGENAKVCYGVENASKVWLAPPMQELSASLARCVDVDPKTTTIYSLTVEGQDGQRVSQEVAVRVGPPKVRIDSVNVSAVNVRAGETVVLCYTATNATAVAIEPRLGVQASPVKGCASDRPVKNTVYVITATGAGGDRDQEKVTVRVH